MCANLVAATIDYGFSIPHHIVIGGKERFFSVKNAIDLIETDEGLIAIHDSVRPLVSDITIKSAFEMAEKKGNGIPVIPIDESIRRMDGNGSKMVDRSKYVRVQTPQCFDIKLLKKAYKQPYNNSFTDDSSVVEALGETIYLVDGNPENIKITTPSDLIIAHAFINHIENQE